MMSSNDCTDGARQSGEPQQEASSGVWSVYYRRGFEDCHRQAVQDVLGSLMTISEEFLGTVVGSEDSRRLVYAFERDIERRIEEMARRSDPGGAAPPLPPGISAVVPPS